MLAIRLKLNAKNIKMHPSFFAITQCKAMVIPSMFSYSWNTSWLRAILDRTVTEKVESEVG